MVLFNYKKLFLIRYMMIKKLKINTPHFSKYNSNQNNSIKDSSSEKNTNKIQFMLTSEKKNFRKKIIRKAQHIWLHVLKHNNSIVFRKKNSSKNYFNSKRNVFFINFFLKNSFLKSTKYFYTHLDTQGLMNCVPRFFWLFLLNNQQDLFIQQKLSSSKDVECSKASILLKKKTPTKKALLNYVYNYNLFFLFYKYIYKKERKDYNLQKQNLNFFYNYTLIMLVK